MSEVLTLPIDCALCGRPTAVDIERHSEAFLLATTHIWVCPHCYGSNNLMVDGRILGVSRGHDHPDSPKS